MANEDQVEQRSLIRSSLLWHRRERPAHGELVWNADVATVKPASTEEPSPQAPQSAVDRDPTDVNHDVDRIASEIATRRAEALARLDAELSVRREELAHTLDRQRAEAEERIATVERLEREAMARWHAEADRLWAAEQPRKLVEHIEVAIAAELGGVRRRIAGAEARLRQELEARLSDETSRLEAWRVSERERIEAELAAEAQRFNDGLMRQLQEFEFQLAERLREQEERLARWWAEAETLARERVAGLLDEAFGTDPSSRS